MEKEENERGVGVACKGLHNLHHTFGEESLTNLKVSFCLRISNPGVQLRTYNYTSINPQESFPIETSYPYIFSFDTWRFVLGNAQ